MLNSPASLLQTQLIPARLPSVSKDSPQIALVRVVPMRIDSTTCHLRRPLLQHLLTRPRSARNPAFSGFRVTSQTRGTILSRWTALNADRECACPKLLLTCARARLIAQNAVLEPHSLPDPAASHIELPKKGIRRRRPSFATLPAVAETRPPTRMIVESSSLQTSKHHLQVSLRCWRARQTVWFFRRSARHQNTVGRLPVTSSASERRTTRVQPQSNQGVVRRGEARVSRSNQTACQKTRKARVSPE